MKALLKALLATNAHGKGGRLKSYLGKGAISKSSSQKEDLKKAKVTSLEILNKKDEEASEPHFRGDLAFSLGFETLQNLKQTRAHLQEATQRQRVRNALLTRPHEYAVGDEVLLSTENCVTAGKSQT
jgi:predicted ribonuclease toxin of YeeF-YezG toxin-antitoxin module